MVRAQVGEEVTILAEEHHPDLIVLDVELPGEQRGWEAIATLRTAAEGNGAPIIACSWLARVDAMSLVPDCAAYLQKPDLHYDDFVQAVSNALKDAGFERAQR